MSVKHRTRSHLTRFVVLSRLPTGIAPKLVAMVIALVLLLIGMGAAGLLVVRGLNDSTQQLIQLQRRIAAFRQVQHDTTAALFTVSSAMLSAEARTLENAVRQLYQFGYDLDRLAFVAKGEVELLDRLKNDHRRFADIVTQAVGLIRASEVGAARRLDQTELRAVAERLERTTSEMVNKAESDMLDAVEASERSYQLSRLIVVGFAVSGVVLALVLGYAASWSVVGPAIDRLLHAIMPAPAVIELEATNRVQPRRFESVTVFYADIIGFTAYCDSHSPEEVVSNLQLLVERFETLAAQHGLEKIKTIGDAVLATGNLLAPHAEPVLASVKLGFDLMEAANTNPARWQIRAGIHVGPVVAGIIGQSKLSYDLWGDTVNVAARLASLDGRGLTLSKAAWAQVNDRCVGVPLGEVPIKGKAPLSVWRCEALSKSGGVSWQAPSVLDGA